VCQAFEVADGKLVRSFWNWKIVELGLWPKKRMRRCRIHRPRKGGTRLSSGEVVVMSIGVSNHPGTGGVNFDVEAPNPFGRIGDF
jgi:hypothetical protein